MVTSFVYPSLEHQILINSVMNGNVKRISVLGVSTTCAISVYHHWSCEFEFCSWRGVLDTTLCDKVCQWLVTGRWFSPCTPVSSTNKTDRHNITEIMLKVALNTINLKPYGHALYFHFRFKAFRFPGIFKPLLLRQ
jgi:hypothetical protein